MSQTEGKTGKFFLGFTGAPNRDLPLQEPLGSGTSTGNLGLSSTQVPLSPGAPSGREDLPHTLWGGGARQAWATEESCRPFTHSLVRAPTVCQALCCDKTCRGPALMGLTVFGGGEPVNPQANRTELWVVIHATEEGLSCSDGVAGGASGRRQSHGKPGTRVPGGRGHRLAGGRGSRRAQ